ncbi:MAG TPA: hypothetical protein VF350_03770 [Candidatus Bathyarchaeia archaeon]
MTELKVQDYSLKSRLPIIKCECDYEILLLPDLKAMDKAVQNHLLEHKNKCAKDGNAKRIECALISQILEKAAESKIRIIEFS